MNDRDLLAGASDRDRRAAILLQKYLDGELTDAEYGQFEQLLESSQENRALLVSICLQKALVPRVFGEESERSVVGHAPRDEQSEDAETPPARRACPTPRPKSLLNWASRHPKGPAIAVAATLLVAALAVMGLIPVKDWVAGDGKAKPEERGRGEKQEFVARLSNWHNDKWLEDTRPPLDDPRLNVGRRLKIESGLIEVTYLTGARVVIEGPAEFVVGSQASGDQEVRHQDVDSRGWKPADGEANSGYLALGKLVARVEGKEAEGFTIGTPSGSVEDKGTEFTVLVDSDGKSKVHVFEGRVRIVGDSVELESSTRELVDGEGLEWSAGGEFYELAGPVGKRYSELHKRLLRANESLGDDFDLLAHFDFEDVAGADTAGWTLVAENGDLRTFSNPKLGERNRALVNIEAGASFAAQYVLEGVELESNSEYVLSALLGVYQSGQRGSFDVELSVGSVAEMNFVVAGAETFSVAPGGELGLGSGKRISCRFSTGEVQATGKPLVIRIKIDNPRRVSFPGFDNVWLARRSLHE